MARDHTQSSYTPWLLLPTVLFVSAWTACLVPLLTAQVEEVPYATLNTMSEGPFTDMDVMLETKESSTTCTIFFKAPFELSPHSQSEDLPHHDYMHRFSLHGLLPDTAYHYRVDCDKTAVTSSPAQYPYAFHTFPDSAIKSPRSLLIISDPQIDPTVPSHMAPLMHTIMKTVFEPSPVIIPGDFVQYSDNEKMWRRFFHNSRPVLGDRPIFGVPGNHDCDRYRFDQYPYSERYFPVRGGGYNHSWMYGNSTLIVGVGDAGEIPPQPWLDQLDWLRKTLETHKDVPIKILVSHRPMMENYDVMKICEKYRVSIHICGHLHAYQRLDIVSNQSDYRMLEVGLGGGGGVLESLLRWGDLSTRNFTARMRALNPAACFGTVEISEADSRVRFRVWTLHASILDQFDLRIMPGGAVLFPPHDDGEEHKSLLVVTPYAVTLYLAVSFGLLAIVLVFVVPHVSMMMTKKDQEDGYLPIPRADTVTGQMVLTVAESSAVDAYKEDLQAQSLALSLVIALASTSYAALLGVSVGSGWQILVCGAYGHMNTRQFIVTIFVNIAGSLYAWLAAATLLSPNFLRISYNLAIFAGFLLAQTVWGTDFDMFDSDDPDPTVFIMVVGVALAVELAIWLFAGEESSSSETAERLGQMLWAEPTIFLVSAGVLTECFLTWCGLSLSTLLDFLSV